MDRSICLAVDVDADATTVFRAVSTTAGQRAFWTADCEAETDRARFGFVAAPGDLHVSVSTEPDKLVRMHVSSGFPFWEGSTWEWEIGGPGRSETDTGGAVPAPWVRRRVRRDRSRVHGADLGDDPGPAVPVREQWNPAAVLPGNLRMTAGPISSGPRHGD